jgi:hypothetical protein
MSINIKNLVETAWITTLEANTYISTNSIPVRKFFDNSENATPPLVMVHVEPAQNTFDDRGPLYNCKINIAALTYQSDDEDQTDLDTLYNEILDVVHNTSLTTLATNDGGVLTWHGVDEDEPNIEELDGDGYQAAIAAATCHIQI